MLLVMLCLKYNLELIFSYMRALDAIMKEMLLSKDLITIKGKGIFNPRTLVSLDCGPYVMIDGYEMKVHPQTRKIRLNFNEVIV